MIPAQLEKIVMLATSENQQTATQIIEKYNLRYEPLKNHETEVIGRDEVLGLLGLPKTSARASWLLQSCPWIKLGLKEFPSNWGYGTRKGKQTYTKLGLVELCAYYLAEKKGERNGELARRLEKLKNYSPKPFSYDYI
jgi:hypothetical protein